MARTFTFGGEQFAIAGDAALYWPSRQALLVSDLHLEKASSYAARSGQMLPPYDSMATLHDLTKLIETHDVRSVYCLGDNFHDDEGEARLASAASELLRALTSRLDWIWITGNHDREVSGRWGGTAHDELAVGPIILRHEAEADCGTPEISGHFHPKYRFQHRGRNVSRRCFVMSETKIIMPAFGALTGGMDAAHKAIFKACGHSELTALVPTEGRFARFPLAA